MADDFLSKLSTVQELQTNIHSFGEEVRLQCYENLGEISQYCRKVHSHVALRCDGRNNGTAMELSCTVPECLFHIVCTKSASKKRKGYFEVRSEKSYYEHITSEGVPCGGQRKMSAAELTQNVAYLTQREHDVKAPRKGKKTIERTQKVVAHSAGGVEPTVAVVKAADTQTRVKPSEQITSYNLLVPYCERLKQLNPGYNYTVDKDKDGKFIRTCVLLPYALLAFSACFDVVGLDTAHLGTISLNSMDQNKILDLCGINTPQNSTYTIDKLVVTMIVYRLILLENM